MPGESSQLRVRLVVLQELKLASKNHHGHLGDPVEGRGGGDRNPAG